jgi:hypothetical protein
MSEEPRPGAPEPDEARTTPTPAQEGAGVPVPPIPGPNPPGAESPHDFIRRRMRELREAEPKKNG